MSKRFLTLALVGVLVFASQVYAADVPAGAPVAASRVTDVLRQSMMEGRRRPLRDYLAAGGNPNALFVRRATGNVRLLHMAVEMHNEYYVRLLCEAGAQLAAPVDGSGATVLLTAVDAADTEIAQTLIEFQRRTVPPVGFEQASLTNQLTAFLAAADKGAVCIGKALRNAGANIHAVTSNGENALHQAAAAGNYNFVAWLLDLPAEDRFDINAVTTAEGFNAYDLAVLNDHGRIASLFEEVGATHTAAFAAEAAEEAAEDAAEALAGVVDAMLPALATPRRSVRLEEARAKKQVRKEVSDTASHHRVPRPASKRVRWEEQSCDADTDDTE